jgi:hypothetical protein
VTHGFHPRGVGDQDGRDQDGPRDHRAVGAPKHAAASGGVVAGGHGRGRVLLAARGVPGG